MDADIREALAELRGLHGDGPFGDVVVRSNRIKAGVSRGLQEAASNLLAKALGAVAAGDELRARGYVHRAVQLPVDEHEQVDPARWAASMLLFNAVTDAMEACEEDDPAWLDAAEQVLRTAGEDARQALLHALWALAGDYRLPQREARRVRDLVGRAEPRDWALSEPPEPDVAVSAILGVVRAVAAYHAASGAGKSGIQR